MTDYYEILEVSKDATKDEIKSAFRKKARQYHPDVNKAPDAEEKFKELGKAYETLMDDNKRATYDRFGEDGLKNAGFDTGGPFAGGFGDLNDIFNSFFGGMGFGFGGGRVDPNAPQRGDDLRLDVQIEFEEAVFGLNKEIKFDHLEFIFAVNVFEELGLVSFGEGRLTVYRGVKAELTDSKIYRKVCLLQGI